MSWGSIPEDAQEHLIPLLFPPPPETHWQMGQDSDRVPVAEDLAPAHCGYCTYGHWWSGAGVRCGYRPCLLPVKRASWFVWFLSFGIPAQPRAPKEETTESQTHPKDPSSSPNDFCTEWLQRPPSAHGIPIGNQRLFPAPAGQA